jgi:high-affinity nickel-transport protein
MMTLYTSTSLARDTIAILYYSIVLSAITVVVAICIGTIQLLSLISNFSQGKFWDGVDKVSDHFDIVGGAICGAFVIFGGLSVVCYGPWRRRMERKKVVPEVELEAFDKKKDEQGKTETKSVAVTETRDIELAEPES